MQRIIVVKYDLTWMCLAAAAASCDWNRPGLWLPRAISCTDSCGIDGMFIEEFGFWTRSQNIFALCIVLDFPELLATWFKDICPACSAARADCTIAVAANPSPSPPLQDFSLLWNSIKLGWRNMSDFPS